MRTTKGLGNSENVNRVECEFTLLDEAESGFRRDKGDKRELFDCLRAFEERLRPVETWERDVDDDEDIVEPRKARGTKHTDLMLTKVK